MKDAFKVCLEFVLSELEKDIINGLLDYYLSVPSNTYKEEWEALGGLAHDRRII